MLLILMNCGCFLGCRILVWEDGYCDLYECEQAGSGYIKGRFGADVFFKMSHEVYNYGEGWVTNQIIYFCLKLKKMFLVKESIVQ